MCTRLYKVYDYYVKFKLNPLMCSVRHLDKFKHNLLFSQKPPTAASLHNLGLWAMFLRQTFNPEFSL